VVGNQLLNDVLVIKIDILGDIEVTVRRPQLDVFDPLRRCPNWESDRSRHHPEKTAQSHSDLAGPSKHNSLELGRCVELVVEFHMLGVGREPTTAYLS
jgi:hypothetical protein